MDDSHVGPAHAIDTVLLGFRNCSLTISKNTRLSVNTQAWDAISEKECFTEGPHTRVGNMYDNSVIPSSNNNHEAQPQMSHAINNDGNGRPQVLKTQMEPPIMAENIATLGKYLTNSYLPWIINPPAMITSPLPVMTVTHEKEKAWATVQDSSDAIPPDSTMNTNPLPVVNAAHEKEKE